MTATITVAQLRKHGARCGQLKLFKAMFGKVVMLTSRDAAVDLATKHVADFDWGWVARHLLCAAAHAEFEPIRAAAWAKFGQFVRRPAWVEYGLVCGATFAGLYYDQETAHDDTR